ncbi:MAG: NUDIX hydrolase [Deltaproteobacteria bacterium]|nr:NUDIX hydrolase [Deltaproteobacteria bacterium]
MLKHWPVVESVVEKDFRIFSLRRDRAVSPRTGAAHDFFVLETRDWVNVIPVTPDGDVVMVRQYRHGIRQLTLEIPGGIVDHESEDPMDAAGRELLEETGYRAGRIVHLGSVQAQPALQNNFCHTYLALDAERVAEPDPDAGEDLQVVRFPLDDVPRRIRTGEISHGLVLAAFYWYELWLKEGAPGR